MRIYKCDRCGKEVESSEHLNLHKFDTEFYELCEDCAAELQDLVSDFMTVPPHDNSGKWKPNSIFPEYTIDNRGIVAHRLGTKLISAKIKLKDSIVTLIGSYWGVVLDPEEKICTYQRHYFTPYKMEPGDDLYTFVINRNWNRLINWDNVIEWDYLELE